ncbi:unnamed protein product, partial [Choristocarpus tenellus]
MRPEGRKADERAGIGGKSKRSRGSLSVGNSRTGKRSRTPPQSRAQDFSAGSCTSSKRSRIGQSSTPNSQSPASVTATNDRFVDDVRFDVVPKDMCDSSTNGGKGGGDSDTVVQNQLDSLGSVLAQAKFQKTSSNKATGEEVGTARSKSTRSGRRTDPASSENLLSRWLLPSQESELHESHEDNVTNEDGDPPPTVSASGSKALDAPRDSNERCWAEKALQRKKLADAKKGRKMRLQQKSNAPASSAFPVILGRQRGGNPLIYTDSNDSRQEASVKSSEKGSNVSESAPISNAADVVIKDKSLSPSKLRQEPNARISLQPPESSSSVPPAGGKVTNYHSTMGTENGRLLSVDGSSGPSGVSGDSCIGDEYGDNDFSFLSDADLQRMEDVATQVAAASKQQQPGDNTSRRCRLANGKDGDGGIKARSERGVKCGLEPVIRGSRNATRQGQTIKVGTRPPLKPVASFPQSVRQVGGHHSHSASQPTGFKGGQSQGKSMSQGQGFVTGRGRGGNLDLSAGIKSSQDRVGRGRGVGVLESAPQRVNNGGSSLARPRQSVRSLSQQGTGLGIRPGPGSMGEGSDLFTTYGGIEEFVKSKVKPSVLKQGQRGSIARAATDPGQAHNTGWAMQGGEAGHQKFVAQCQGPAPSLPQPPTQHPPDLVHRRYLVLEVIQVANSGPVAKEKLLVALEQGQESPLDVEGSDGGGMLAARQEISLRQEWYNCEVEPGDTVHVVNLGGGDLGEKKQGKIGDKGGGGRGRGGGGVHASPVVRDVIVDNDSSNLLVVHPDILVSPTRVADTVLCSRKALLQARLASDASRSQAAVMGNLEHELFEASLLEAAGLWKEGVEVVAAAAAGASVRTSSGSAAASEGVTLQFMHSLVDHIVQSNLEALYGVGLDEDTARRELLAVCRPILEWHREFLTQKDGKKAEADNVKGLSPAGNHGGGGNGTRDGKFKGSGVVCSGPNRSHSVRVVITSIIATEDDVWSPVLGLKGIMDATVAAMVMPLATSMGQGGLSGAGGDLGKQGNWERVVMAVELKTGKRIGDAYSSHRAQVMLYTLLLRIRYGEGASSGGLLVYTSHEGLQTGEIRILPPQLRPLL